MDTIIPKNLIERFLAEDIAAGDVTSSAIFDRKQLGEGVFIAKDSFICCGIGQVAATVFSVQNKTIEILETTEEIPGKRNLTVCFGFVCKDAGDCTAKVFANVMLIGIE